MLESSISENRDVAAENIYRSQSGVSFQLKVR